MTATATESRQAICEPGAPALVPGDVQLWKVDLRCDAEGLERDRRLLSPQERARARAYRFDADRRRFIVRRAALRSILGRRLSRRPEELIFTDADGRPALAETSETGDVRFSLTDSGDLALIAFVIGRDVGVDLERHRKSVPRSLERSLHPKERRAIDALPPERRTTALLQCWTQKEAVLKAMGIGLRLHPSSLEVAVAPAPAALLDVASQPGEVARWSLQSITSIPGYVGAVATQRVNDR